MRPAVPLTVSIPAPMFDGLGRMAQQRGWKRELLASELLAAAYTARVQPVGDAALEAAVARIGEPGSGDAARIAPLESKIAELRAELNNTHASLDQSRRHSAAQIAKVSELQQLLWAAQEEIDGLKDALDAEKMKHAEIFSDLYSARQELEALKAAQKKLPTIAIMAEERVDPELQAALIAAAERLPPTIQSGSIFQHPYAPNPPDPLAGLADCTRRMILALKASGQSPKEIARETDTPLAIVTAVLDQAARPRNRKASAK